MDAKNGNADRKAIVPACSIKEEAGIVTVKVEMPGVEKTGLEVRVEGNILSLEGSRPAEEPRGAYLMRERRQGGFRKTFTIDDTIDRERIEAQLVDGILTLRLSVKEAAKPRRISIA